MLSADRQTARSHSDPRVMCHVFITDASCDGHVNIRVQVSRCVHWHVGICCAHWQESGSRGQQSVLTHQFSGSFESEEPSNQLTNLLFHTPQWAGEGRLAVQQQRRTDTTSAQVTQTVQPVSACRCSVRPLCPVWSKLLDLVGVSLKCPFFRDFRSLLFDVHAGQLILSLCFWSPFGLCPDIKYEYFLTLLRKFFQ